MFTGYQLKRNGFHLRDLLEGTCSLVMIIVLGFNIFTVLFAGNKGRCTSSFGKSTNNNEKTSRIGKKVCWCSFTLAEEN